MRFFAIAAIGLLPSACADSQERQLPNLAEEGFFYDCVALGDALCDGDVQRDLFDTDDSTPSGIPIPARIAVGSLFTIEYFDRVEGQLTRRPVDAATDYFIEETGEEFTALRAGVTTLLARDARGSVSEVLHLEFSEPAEVQIDGAESGLSTGENIDLFAEVFDSERRRLGGALTYTWTVADPTVLRLTPAYDNGPDALSDDHVIIETVAIGVTDVTVRVGELSVTTTIRVGGDV
ncbi:MAG: hypothetical protein ACJA1R_000062 [Flavobacteriales bacterium]|jgi:hypothetical protein